MSPPLYDLFLYTYLYIHTQTYAHIYINTYRYMHKYICVYTHMCKDTTIARGILFDSTLLRFQFKVELYQSVAAWSYKTHFSIMIITLFKHHNWYRKQLQKGRSSSGTGWWDKGIKKKKQWFVLQSPATVCNQCGGKWLPVHWMLELDL